MGSLRPLGQLFIDDQPGPDVRGSAVRHSADGYWEGAGFQLPRGHHILSYRATPFPTLTCNVSVPAARTDTCPLDTSGDYAFLTPAAPATRLLDLRATIDRLPKAQVDALVAAAQTALIDFAANLPNGMLFAGDHYLNSAGQPSQALSAVRITPRFELDRSVTSFDGATCVTLCTLNGPVLSDSAPDAWSIQAPVALSWRYTTPAGQVLQDNGPASALGTSPTSVISLFTRWQGGAWQTPTLEADDAQEIVPVICPTGAHALDVLRAMPGQTTVDQTFTIPYAAPTTELGCVLAGSHTDPTTGKSTGPMALVFYRAGVLVAVNDEAQRAFPTLPLATAHEQTLAQAAAPSSL